MYIYYSRPGKGKGNRTAKAILKNKNKVGGIVLSNFKSYLIAIVIKTEWYRWRYRSTCVDKCNRIENTEVNSYKYVQLNCDKGIKSV